METGGTGIAEFRSKTLRVDVAVGVGADGAGVWYAAGENLLYVEAIWGYNGDGGGP